MKRTIIAVAVALASFGAHAESFFQIEVGAGFVHSAPGADGLWRWDGGTHQLKDNQIGFRGGVRLNLTEPDGWVPGVRINATYYHFGTVNWNSDAGEDADAAHTMGLNPTAHTCYNDNCGDWRNFRSSGNMRAVALTVEPHWNVGHGWDVGFNVGPALFRSTWTSTATALSDGKFGPAGTQQSFYRAPRWQFGQVAGVSVSKGHFTVRYEYLRAPVDRNVTGSGTGDLAGAAQWVPSGIVGQHMVSLNYVF